LRAESFPLTGEQAKKPASGRSSCADVGIRDRILAGEVLSYRPIGVPERLAETKMASAADRVTWRDIVTFWIKVLVVCVVLGTISFFIGRKYLGTMISEGEIGQGAPQISAQVQSSDTESEKPEKAPPDKAKVEIREREASDAEVDRASRDFGLADDSIGTRESGEEAPSSGKRAGGGEEAASGKPGTAGNQTESTSSEEATEGATSSTSGHYVVIAGSFLNPENSQRMLQELQAKGYQPYVSKTTVGDKTYRRVNVGAFSSREQADRLAEELRGAGYEVTVGVR